MLSTGRKEHSEQNLLGRYLRYCLSEINVHRHAIVRISVTLLLIAGLMAIVLYPLSDIVFASHLDQTSSPTLKQTYTLPVELSSPTPSSNAILQLSQTQQMISEAQNDLTIANLIIAWSGFFLAFIATAIIVAGFFGIREVRRLQQLRSEFGTQIQEVAALKKQIEEELEQLVERFENESQIFMEVSYDFGVATNAYKIGDNRRAIEYYLRVMQLQQKNTLVLERLGRTYNNLNDTKQAVHYLEKALGIDPSYIPALQTMALCYRYTDKNRALEYLERCLKINPANYETLDFLGLIYRDQELYNDAIAAHERALAIKKRPETEFYLSILYSIQGDKKRAKLMALNAEDDLQKKEHDERLRQVWKIAIIAGVQIIEGNENEAFQIIQTAIPYITTQSIYDEFTKHLKLLLAATGHNTWIPKFMKNLKIKEA